MVREGMTEIEKVRTQAKAYIQTFFVDVVIYRLGEDIAFIQSGLMPEGAEELEVVTRYYTG